MLHTHTCFNLVADFLLFHSHVYFIDGFNSCKIIIIFDLDLKKNYSCKFSSWCINACWPRANLDEIIGVLFSVAGCDVYLNFIINILVDS